jgi:Protein of unknown function (DUF1571)
MTPIRRRGLSWGIALVLMLTACARSPRQRQMIQPPLPPLPTVESPAAPRGAAAPGFIPDMGRRLPPTPEPPPGFQPVLAEQEGDTLGTLVVDARKAFAGVRDYACTFVKQERIGGRLLSEQTAQMLVREEPFSVYLRFVAPSLVAGQEVCYVAGRYGDRVRVRGNGLKGAFGFVTLPLDDPRITSQSRHSVAEAGLRSLIEQVATAHSELHGDTSQLEVSAARLYGRPCTRVALHLPEGSRQYGERGVIYFDRASKLPVRFEAYDRAGELLESYTYFDVRLNVGVPESAFQK